MATVITIVAHFKGPDSRRPTKKLTEQQSNALWEKGKSRTAPIEALNRAKQLGYTEADLDPRRRGGRRVDTTIRGTERRQTTAAQNAQRENAKNRDEGQRGEANRKAGRTKAEITRNMAINTVANLKNIIVRGRVGRASVSINGKDVSKRNVFVDRNNKRLLLIQNGKVTTVEARSGRIDARTRTKTSAQPQGPDIVELIQVDPNIGKIYAAEVGELLLRYGRRYARDVLYNISGTKTSKAIGSLKIRIRGPRVTLTANGFNALGLTFLRSALRNILRRQTRRILSIARRRALAKGITSTRPS